MRRAGPPVKPATRALFGGLVTLVLVSCTEQAEPRPSPIVARRLGGDSIAPGPMIHVCHPEDAGCVPTYAVTCAERWSGDSADAPPSHVMRPRSVQEEAWCAANATTSAPH
jgi:hypothetical protein